MPRPVYPREEDRAYEGESVGSERWCVVADMGICTEGKLVTSNLAATNTSYKVSPWCFDNVVLSNLHDDVIQALESDFYWISRT